MISIRSSGGILLKMLMKPWDKEKYAIYRPAEQMSTSSAEPLSVQGVN